MPPSASAAGPNASALAPERALSDRWPWPLVPGTASLLCWALAAGLTGQATWQVLALCMLLLGAVPGGLVGWAHQRSKPRRQDAVDSTWLAGGQNRPAAKPWLGLYRAALAGQGLTWAAACWWLWPGLEGAAPVLVITSLAMGVAGLATVGGLDALAGLIWGLPAATGLSVRAWLAADAAAAGSPQAQGAWMLVAVAVCTLPLLALQAWRATRVAQARQQQVQSLQDLLQLHWRSDQQLRLAEQVAQLGSFFWNPVTGNLHWSDQHCRLWGHVPGTVQPSYELFAQGVHPDDRPLLELQLQKSLRDGGAYERFHRVQWSDGTVREVHARGEVTLDERGVAVRMIGTVQDITDRRAAEARLHAHEFVVNAIADPISVIDEHRVYSMVNDAWCRITGLTRERVEHQPPEAVQTTVGSDERNAALQRCLQDDTIEQVLVKLPMPGLGARWWEVTIFPYHEPAWAGQLGAAKRRRAVMVTRDVTARQNAQAALAESLDNLKLTLNATGDAIFASGSRSPDEPLLFVNDRMLHMWNIPPEMASTLTASDVMLYAAPLWMNPQREVARVREAISNHNLQEDRLELNDGRVLLRRCIPTQLGGREVRVWGFRDITVESRALTGLRAAEAQQRDLLAAFPGYITCLDGDLRYSFVNERLAALLETPVEQFVGSTVAELVGPDRAPLMARRLARALDGEVLSYERLHPATAERPDLHLLITLARGVDRASGRPVVYGFGTDITKLKQTQAELLTAKEEAERANRAKSVFLSNMSHELRTPMNAVLGFAQLLESDQEPALSPRQRGQVREILQGGRHLLVLINDLLDLARIEADQLPLHPVPVGLRALMAECITFLASLAQRHRIEVTLPEGDDDLLVLADPTRLRQVLLNLLGNAIKYNHEGGWVRLTCEREGPLVRTAVIDGGPGISHAQQQRLFQRFERLGADGGPVEGAGIGLALSQRLMQLMGGQIGATSQPGEGSQFWFSLPEASAGDGVMPTLPPPSSHGSTPLRAQASQPTVLYIEDNPVNTLLMQAMFERLEGVVLDCEASPLTGLARALGAPPTLILLDLQMPEMDGYTLMQHLRADPATAHIPVIAVSASATSQDRARGMAAGFADYLTKPLDLLRLQAAVQATLAGA